jgi:hypothetical protein
LVVDIISPTQKVTKLFDIFEILLEASVKMSFKKTCFPFLSKYKTLSMLVQTIIFID